MSNGISTIVPFSGDLHRNRLVQGAGRIKIRLSVLVLFFVFIGLNFVEDGVDYQAYSQYFEELRSLDFFSAFVYRLEPVFVVLTLLFNQILPNSFLVYLAFLILSIILKTYIISKTRLAGFLFAILVVFYLFRFFPIHELTQIRVSLAIGLVMMSFQRYDTRFLKWLLFALGCLTHYSTLILLPFVFLVGAAQDGAINYIKHERLIWTLIFITAAILGVISQLLINYLTPYFMVLQIYDSVGFGEQTVSPFNATILLDIFGILTGFALYGKMSASTRSWLYFQTLGLFTFYAMINFPIMAFRVKELFCVFWIFYIRDAMEYKGLVKFHAISFATLCIVMYFYFYFFAKSAIFQIF